MLVLDFAAFGFHEADKICRAKKHIFSNLVENIHGRSKVYIKIKITRGEVWGT